jgi:predicted  nucleic acid-binding Zn-ribbon protein
VTWGTLPEGQSHSARSVLEDLIRDQQRKRSGSMDDSERRRLKEEMDILKSDMDITFQEIAEVKERIGSLVQQRRYLEDSIGWVGNRMSSAKDSGDREESGDYSRQNLRNYEELRDLNSRINLLIERKRELWAQQNSAKDHFRKLRDELHG